jgi:hypothetical protein
VSSSSTPSDCLSGDELDRFLECRLTAEESDRARAHLSSGCASCQQAVVAASRKLAGSGPDITRHPAEGTLPALELATPRLQPGVDVARYRVVRYIGGGGGGQVYEAFDPQLGRAVALKLLRAERDQGTQVVGEARALAKLSHPNVVNVYDAGIFDGRAFVVMELVEGLSLARWLEQAPRDWHAIVDRFVDAGKGLAAAHAAGLVHRDVKPANVIVGVDGRARMADFGLAEPSGHTPRSGQIAGTPAYMAPEQLVGEPADARSDQFSFCVAFYWALYGQHPYRQTSIAGATLLTVAREVMAGRIRRPPPGRAVPAWLERAVARGLSAEPRERHPSMEALLEEIARGLRAPPPGGAGGDAGRRDAGGPGGDRGDLGARPAGGRRPPVRRRQGARTDRGVRRGRPERGRRLQPPVPALRRRRRPLRLGPERPLLHPTRSTAVLA